MIHKNPKTPFADKEVLPEINETAFIHPLAAVIGNVTIGKKVRVSPFASVCGDEGQPLFVGDDSNVQDGAVIHALETDRETGKNRNLVLTPCFFCDLGVLNVVGGNNLIIKNCFLRDLTTDHKPCCRISKILSLSRGE